MTSSVINPLPTMGFNLPKPRTAAAGSAARVVQRGGNWARVLITLSWLVGITGSFLTVGVIGMFADDLPPIHLKTLEEDVETPLEEILNGDQMGLPDTAEQSAEGDPVLPTVISEAIETPPENLDLPEIAEAMTLEDVFAVPTAPKIEDALRPIDPVAKPKPAPQRTLNTAVAAGGGGASSGRTQGGQAGGMGGRGNGTGGKWINPKPPYPDFAERAGMHGTVRLKISVSPSGVIESVSVISTSGYSPLDESAASWVRREWRAPATGVARSFSQPFNFKLP